MSECRQHGTTLKLRSANGGYSYESCEQCEEESRERVKKIFEGIAARKAKASPINSESVARWIWCRFVGIPITEPYDKEYQELFNRIEELRRTWFMKGLNEARKQIHGVEAQ